MSTAQSITTAGAHFPAQSLYETGPKELMEMLERTPESVFIVDIQDPEIFEAAHIPGARNVHIEDLCTECAGLPRDRTIVIYCGDVTCGLPLWAALELAQVGFRAQYLHGGFAEWTKAELPIENSPPPPPPEY
jgi:rhodanese-related sulfurtransferase